MHVHRGNQPLFTEAKLVEGFSLYTKPLLDRSAAQIESEHLETKAKTLQEQDAEPFNEAQQETERDFPTGWLILRTSALRSSEKV